MFPTPEEMESKKLEKLEPLIKTLQEVCVEKMLQEGVPAKVPLANFPSMARQQVLRNAANSGWKVRMDRDIKLGDVLVIDEAPAATGPRTFLQKLMFVIGG